MKKLGLLSFLFLLISPVVQALDATGAVTDDGRRVVLFPDGTWVYKPGSDQAQKPGQKQQKMLGDVIEGGNGSYSVRFDENKWKIGEPLNEVAEYTLNYLKGDAYAMLIYENADITLDQLKDAVMGNVKNISPDAEIIHQRRIYKNGKEIMVLKYRATVENTALTYYGYYATGNWGVLQFMAWSTTGDFVNYEGDFFELLNGLTIH